jgi:NAD(P)-dependent dehydrogenase (short-subunit alcohol dehydrogenase family)
MNLRDRIALVTGASRGIGASTAEVLARRGSRVVLSGRTIADLECVAAKIRGKGGQALVVPCDVLDAHQVEGMIGRVVKGWGRLDILVNNAGMGTPSLPVEEILPEAWDETMALNLRSAFFCVRVAAPVMKRQEYGRIVNVSSFAGRNYSRMSGPQYGAAKAGLQGFTRQMAVELGPYGINVNAVAPSIVLTARVKAKWEARTEAERQAILSEIPLRRLAQPEEVATVIAFLASDDASYVNGVCVDINGGSYMV